MNSGNVDVAIAVTAKRVNVILPRRPERTPQSPGATGHACSLRRGGGGARPAPCGQPRACSQVKHGTCSLHGPSRGTDGHFPLFLHSALHWCHQDPAASALGRDRRCVGTKQGSRPCHRRPVCSFAPSGFAFSVFHPSSVSRTGLRPLPPGVLWALTCPVRTALGGPQALWLSEPTGGTACPPRPQAPFSHALSPISLSF